MRTWILISEISPVTWLVPREWNKAGSLNYSLNHVKVNLVQNPTYLAELLKKLERQLWGKHTLTWRFFGILKKLHARQSENFLELM